MPASTARGRNTLLVQSSEFTVLDFCVSIAFFTCQLELSAWMPTTNRSVENVIQGCMKSSVSSVLHNTLQNKKACISS